MVAVVASAASATNHVIPNRGGELAAATGVLLAFAYITVGLRIYVRGFMIKSFGTDDWLMVATLVFYSAYSACVLGGIEHGTGRHLTDIKEWSEVEKALKFWWWCEINYDICSTLVKLAIGVFLHRIAVKKPHIWIIRSIMMVNVLFGVYYFFLIVFQCHPVSFFWAKLMPNGTCLAGKIITGSTYCHSAISAVSDWTFGILPVFLIWDVQMNPRTKISVAMILGLGALGSTATLVRIPYISALGKTQDFLWATTDVAIWSTVEIGVGITAGSIATLRPLFRTFLSSTGLSRPSKADSYKPWSPSAGYHRSHSLNNLHGLSKSGNTTTTVQSSKRTEKSLGGSEEHLTPTYEITKTFEVSMVEEGRATESDRRNGGRI